MTSFFQWRQAAVLTAALTILAGCKRDESKTLLEPSQTIAPILGEETRHAAGANKRIALISHDDSWGPPSPVEQAFTAALEKEGYSVFTAKSANLGDPMHRHEIGLQPGDFLEALQNAAGAGAIVSFAGVPLLTPNEAERLPRDHPPILVVATTALGDQLGVAPNKALLESMLEEKIIQTAIVNGGSDSEAPSSNRADATHRSFAQFYTLLRQPQ